MKKLIAAVLIMSMSLATFADTTQTYTQEQVNLILANQNSKVMAEAGPQQQQPQTIVIQQNNNGYNYGWNTWSKEGKTAFIVSMVILTAASIIVPVAIANSYSYDTYDAYGY